MTEQNTKKSSIFQRTNINIFWLLLLFTSFIFLYYPVFLKLIHDWEVDPNYSHGYFIPLIFIFMIWTSRNELKNTATRPNNLGIIILIFGLAQLTVARIGSEYFLEGSSLILVLLGIVLFIWGVEATKILLIPILYLIFMIPLPAIIWNQISFPLALFASTISEQVISSLGMTILREGNILTLPNITLQVVDACSGLRSLLTLLALSALIAYFSEQKNLKRIIIFLAAIPIAIFCNLIRLTVTAILARSYGEKVAHGFIHDFSGIFVFILGLAILLLFTKILERKTPSTT